jgi:hypothetical protein
MMERLMRRVEMLAAAEQKRQAQRLAGRMKEMLGSGSIEVLDTQVVGSGRGLLRRWLIDPSLRFLSSGLK